MALKSKLSREKCAGASSPNFKQFTYCTYCVAIIWNMKVDSARAKHFFGTTCITFPSG